MQCNSLQNFRMRAKSYGYKNVKIKRVGRDEGGTLYKVTAFEPLTGQKVEGTYYSWYFNSLLRYGKKWQKKFLGK